MLISAKRERLTELDKLSAERGAFPIPAGSPNPGGASSHRRGGGDFDDSHRLLDSEFRSGRLNDSGAEKAAELLTEGPQQSRNQADRWVRAAGDPAYRDAFAKLLADPDKGHLLWTTAEADAYRAATDVHAELRAMSTTGSAGGYLVPLTLDPAILLTSDGSNNPLRNLATVKTTATNAWQGVTSAGVTSEWKTEGAKRPTHHRPSLLRASTCTSATPTCRTATRSGKMQ